MHKLTLPAAAAAALLLLPSFAHAGWTAKQTSRSTGGGQKHEQSAKLSFEKDHMRIDQDAQTSVIVDFNTGKFTFLHHGKKQHASITVEQMMAMRDQALAQMESQLGNMPPEIRKQAEDRIKEMKTPNQVKPKATGKNEKVNGFDCAVYKWSSQGGDSEACLATKVGADVTAFGNATAKLADKLAKLGGPGGPGGFAMLELGKTGFPVRMKRTMKMNETTIETVEEISELKEGKIDAGQFKVPAGYTETDLQSMMGGMGPR